MIIWLCLFYVYFYCIFEILKIIVCIILYKNFGTISSRQYWDAVTLEHGLARRGDNARARISEERG